jgi:carbamoyltransferase
MHTRSPRTYVGLGCTFHDPAMAVVNAGGEVVFAEATERYYQVKRGYNLVPDERPYIARLLRDYCDPDTDLVVGKSWSRSALHKIRLLHALFVLGSRLLSRSRRWAPFLDLMRLQLGEMKCSIAQAGEQLRHCYRHMPRDAADASGLPRPWGKGREFRVVHLDHHLTHAAAACYSSPFAEAVCAVIDGFGERSSTSYYHYRGGQIVPLRVPQWSGNSLGLFYGMLCYACGFSVHAGEEWKVMGLAPYGKFDPEIYQALKDVVRVDGLRITGSLFDMCRSDVWHGAEEYDRANLDTNYICPLDPPAGRGKARGYDRADLAFTGQQVFEECLVSIFNHLHGLGISDNLVFSGGCALNSSANGKILEQTRFRHLHVCSAPADDGNALGAALVPYYRDNPKKGPPCEVLSPYLGHRMSQDTLERLHHFDVSGKVVRLGRGGAARRAARELAAGKIIGWVQGRAEFGPRSLGNRSILADPRSADVKDRINSRVKFREEFRPFAPSVLAEYGDEYFEDYQESPYMERTLRFRPAVLDRVPGVVHVNGTGRLQTVRREWNPLFYDLIEEFRRLTGVSLVLNTSFNVMGKPIIHTVEDALALFHTTGLDTLFIEDYMVRK